MSLLVKRRTLLALLAGVVLSAPPSLLLARSGDGKGGHDAGDNDNGGDNDNDGGNDDGGNDDGGDNDGDDSGGSDDGGNDNGDADDSGSDDGGDDGGRSKKRDDVEWSQDRVLKERELGRVIPLKTALRIVNARIHGRVIDVDLMVRSGKPQYRVKVRRTDGVIRTVRLDARTGKVIGILGF